MSNKAVFLDRDHTIIKDTGYISDPSLVSLLPGAAEGIKLLLAAGYKTIVVTNQSGVARGLLTEAALAAIHAEMSHQLASHGARVDAIYYCPFHPEGTVPGYIQDSELRKPKPGMLLAAAREHDIDLPKSWMVGDSARDIEAGQRAHCRTIRLRGEFLQLPGDSEDEDVQADYTVATLLDAARVILANP